MPETQWLLICLAKRDGWGSEGPMGTGDAAFVVETLIAGDEPRWEDAIKLVEGGSRTP